MESSLKLMKTVRVAMLVAVALYVFLGERVPHPSRTTNPIFYYALTGMAIAMIVSMLFVRRMTITKFEGSLAPSKNESRSLNSWAAWPDYDLRLI
jgi:hypothetical protein